MKPVNRRAFLATAGAAVGGFAVGAGGATALQTDEGGGLDVGTVAFHGIRQAGIVTPTPSRLHIAAFDVLDGTSRGCATSCASGAPPRRG